MAFALFITGAVAARVVYGPQMVPEGKFTADQISAAYSLWTKLLIGVFFGVLVSVLYELLPLAKRVRGPRDGLLYAILLWLVVYLWGLSHPLVYEMRWSIDRNQVFWMFWSHVPDRCRSRGCGVRVGAGGHPGQHTQRWVGQVISDLTAVRPSRGTKPTNRVTVPNCQTRCRYVRPPERLTRAALRSLCAVFGGHGRVRTRRQVDSLILREEGANGCLRVLVLDPREQLQAQLPYRVRAVERQAVVHPPTCEVARLTA
jgi:hypothetical protein